MDIPKLYEEIEVDYNIIIKRLRKEELIEKYLGLLVADDSFKHLQTAIEAKNYEEVFKAAHTIKGMALNLELTPLAKASAGLSDYLRGCGYIPENETIVDEKYQNIMEEYERIQKLIH